MKETEFTYSVEPGSYHGSIWLYEDECSYEDKGILNLKNENDLLEFLKKNPDNANTVVTLDTSEKVLAEGKRLAEKLNLQFIHA